MPLRVHLSLQSGPGVFEPALFCIARKDVNPEILWTESVEGLWHIGSLADQLWRLATARRIVQTSPTESWDLHKGKKDDKEVDDRDRFNTFTKQARKVLSLAQDEAQRFQHNYIGTEHLLLGLIGEGEGVAAKVLSNLGVELNKVRSAVEFIIGRGDRIVPGEIGMSPRTKKGIELAVDEARRLNHIYIGTEHLLLGLLREGESVAIGILESLGVNLEDARAQTIKVLGLGQEPPSQPDVPPQESVEKGGTMSRIFRAKVQGVERIEPYRLPSTPNLGSKWRGWEYVGRVEKPSQEATYGLVYGRSDGIDSIENTMPEQLVGIINLDTRGEELRTKAIVYRVPFFVRRGDRERGLSMLAFPNLSKGMAGANWYDGRMAAYRVGIISEKGQSVYMTTPDGLLLFQEGYESHLGGERFLGFVDYSTELQRGSVFVAPAGSITSSIAYVDCGYIAPAIQTELMAGAAMLQIFGLA